MHWPSDYINRVVHGDCLDVMAAMPDDAVDIVVTSPPYNHLGSSRRRAKGWSTSPGMYAQNKWHKQISSGDGTYEDSWESEDEYRAWLNEIVAQCLRVSKGLVWINHKVRYRDGVGLHPLRSIPFPVWSEVVWDRGGSMALNCKRFAPSHELIYGFGRPHYWDDNQNIQLSVWRIKPSVNEFHPCEFPIVIPKRLIAASCPPGGVVLDPMIGSGSTAIAAIEAGRQWIGIEKKAIYCQMAEKRIDKATRQLTFTL
jgi:DNA modification methylase